MKLVKSFLLAFGVFASVMAFATKSYAQTAPEFPACSNPQGSLKVSYADGQHAIVGETGLRAGADSVYELEDGNVLQCFCSVGGSGVQTNWWRINLPDQEEIDNLVKLGWNFIPSGSPWGLDASAYMAYNSPYSCGGGFTASSGGGNPGAPVCNSDRPEAPVITSVDRSGTTATITWTKVDKATHYTIAYGPAVGDYPYGVPDTGNVTSYTIGALNPNVRYYFVVYAVNNCMPSESSTQGQVLGASTGGSVLGLAATGTWMTILTFAVLGLTSLIIGSKLRNSSKKA